MTVSAVRQKAFYAATADAYDDAHETEIEHRRAFDIAIPLMRGIGATRVLDVGCGTGKAIRAIGEAAPEIEVVGIDPSPDLLAVARERYGIPADRLIEGSGQRLPFPDKSFDAVLAVAVLHHVPDPWAVVAEMIRVSRRFVLISDANRFGQGSTPSRLVKNAVRMACLTGHVDRWRNGADGSYTSDGDGVAWPFSLFDLLPNFREAGIDPFVVPTKGTAHRDERPLMDATHALIVADVRGLH